VEKIAELLRLFVGEDEWRLDGELSMLFFLELLEKCL
jgi:hypothetical protein